jgi:hypothetical protein
MPFKYLHFVSTHLSSIPEEISPTRCSVHRSSSSNSFDSTADASLVSTRNWFYDGAKSSSFMPKVPPRKTWECISNDTAPKAPLRRRLSDENLEWKTISLSWRLHLAAPKAPLWIRLSNDFGVECDIPVVNTVVLPSNKLPLSIHTGNWRKYVCVRTH